MKNARWFCAVALVAVVAPCAAQAQEFPKPGPEHEVLKKWEGTWDTTMRMGAESKGTATFKMELGGLWLVGSSDGDLGGLKFSGRKLETYDAKKKKYVGVWFDSTSTSPMLMEGDYDKEKKTLTMSGEAPGPDGKPEKFNAVSEWKDDDTINFSMYVFPDNPRRHPPPAFTITYKRRK